MGYKPYRVGPGECIASIAFDLGFSQESIWNDPENADLVRKRAGDGNVLAENDVLQIPDREPIWRPCAVNAQHVFKRKSNAEKLLVQFKQNGKPRSNEAYVLTIEGVIKDGKTDKDGVIDVWVRANAKEGKLRFPANGEEYVLQLGNLDPASTVAGAKARLRNLGLFAGEVDAEPDSRYLVALRSFQRQHKLESEEGLSEATQAKLKSMHGS